MSEDHVVFITQFKGDNALTGIGDGFSSIECTSHDRYRHEKDIIISRFGNEIFNFFDSQPPRILASRYENLPRRWAHADHKGPLPSCSVNLPNEYRSALYAVHNGFRHKVAIGEFVREFQLKRYNNRSRMMTGMTYDCHYEQVARKFIHEKKTYFQTRLYNVNHYYESDLPRNTTIPEMLAKAFLHWLTQDGPRQRLIYQISYYMGCAVTASLQESKKLWDFRLLCTYTNTRPRFAPLYVHPWGKPCNESRDCDGYRLYWFECKYNLCFAPQRDYIKM